MAFLEPHLIPGMDLASGAAVTEVLRTIDDEVLVSGFPDEIVGGLDSIIPVVFTPPGLRILGKWIGSG